MNLLIYDQWNKKCFNFPYLSSLLEELNYFGKIFGKLHSQGRLMSSLRNDVKVAC